MKNQLLLILLLLPTIFFHARIGMCKTYSISASDTIGVKKTKKSLSSDQSIKIDNLKNLPKDNYPIQLGAFKLKENAEALKRKTEMYMGEIVKIIEEEGYYKVRLTGLHNNKVLYYLSPVFSSDTAKNEEINYFVNPDTNKITVTVSDTMRTQAADTGSYQAPAVSYKTQVVESANKIRHKFIFLDNNSPWLKKINYFGKSVNLIIALIVVITVTIFAMIIFLIFILANRTRMEKEQKLSQYLLEKYQGMLVDYLFGDKVSEVFMTIASNKFRRQVLINQIIDISINLKGDAKEKLQDLYVKLGLKKDSLSRAYSRQWHKKIKGFRELAFMNIREANDEIYRCLESNNEILRIEAQIALVRLNDENPFEFLGHLIRPFALWEQITLHELLVQHEMKPPSFSQWLNSPNDTVVIFSLRMIREYRQDYSEQEVLNVLKHNSPDVRKIAIEVTGDMGMYKALTILKKMYKKENYDNCLEILRSMGKMPDEKMLGFLKLVLDKEDDVQLQIEATKAIGNMGESGTQALVKIMESKYKNYNIIIRHVLDKRIN